MRSFDEIFELAAGRKGGPAALEALLSKPKGAKELAGLGDDRYLAGLTKAVFRAGFNWKVIEAKWDGFEAAFEGFEPHRWALMSDEDLDRLVSDTRIVRHAKKILSVRDNGILLCDLAKEHGSAGRCFADWPAAEPMVLEFGLPRESRDWPILRLSTGERQRLALARALVQKPRVLLLDEPTSGLDSMARDVTERLIRNHLAEGGGTIWATHDPEQAKRMARRALVMERGRVLEAVL